MGCTQAGVEHRSDLYDIFINVPAAEIGVAPHAKGSKDVLLVKII